MKFALFLAATGMMQQLFNAIDAVIMGQFVGKRSHGGRGEQCTPGGFSSLLSSSAFPWGPTW
jgi:hypothetical protein